MIRAGGGEALVTLATGLISLGLFHRRLRKADYVEDPIRLEYPKNDS